MKRIFPVFLATAAVFLMMPAFGLAAAPFTVTKFDHHPDGVDQVFDVTVRNDSDAELHLRGRLVLINVYDVRLPTNVLIDAQTVPAHGSADISARWSDAPVIGLVRTILILTGDGGTTVTSYDLWILPVTAGSIFLGILVFAVLVVLAMMRLPVWLRKRVPDDMVVHVVEYDDSVVTLSNRYGGTWEDIVKANRLKPPYDLKPGSRILIPKRRLRHPGDAQPSP